MIADKLLTYLSLVTHFVLQMKAEVDLSAESAPPILWPSKSSLCRHSQLEWRRFKEQALVQCNAAK